MGCDERTVLIIVSLPAVESSLPFQSGSLAPILSISGCTSILLNLWICRGSPRYFLGKLPILPGKFCRSCDTVVLSKQIGKIAVFEILILRPEQLPKNVKIFSSWSSSTGYGLEKMVVSSAYSEQHNLAALGSTGWRTPFYATTSMIRWRGSMASMNRSGDSGSPYHSPLACRIPSVSCPFTSTFDDAVLRNVAIQSRHLVMNPSSCMTSSRNGQLMESKALEISSLMNSASFFF